MPAQAVGPSWPARCPARRRVPLEGDGPPAGLGPASCRPPATATATAAAADGDAELVRLASWTTR